MSEEKEVRVSLVVDDKSSETLDKVKAGMEDLKNKAAEHSSSMGDGLKKASGHAEGLAGNLDKAGESSSMLSSAAELLSNPYVLAAAAIAAVTAALGAALTAAEKLGEAAVEAAEEAETQIRMMSSMLGMMDQGQHSMELVKQFSKETREELEMTGLELGVTTKQMTSSFNDIISRGIIGAEKAKELTEQMALVGRVVPGGMKALSAGIVGIEKGAVSARNPLVQLIAATQTLKGNAKQVATQMKKMTTNKQIELAQKALTKQAEQMDRTPTLDSIGTSLRGVREAFLESIGQPMLEHIMPPLIKVKEFLLKHLEDIKEFGSRISGAFAEVIDFLTDTFSGIYNVVQDNWDSIKDTVNDAMAEVKIIWGWVLSHKDDIVDSFKVALKIGQVFFEGSLKLFQTLVVIVDVFIVKPLVACWNLWKDITKVVLIPAFKWIADTMTHVVDYIFGSFEKMFDMMLKVVVKVAEFISPLAGIAVQAGIIGMKSVMGEFASEKQKIKAEQDEEEALKKIQNVGPKVSEGIGGKIITGSGGNISIGTINIKQDFRDQDPDRVALIFRRDLVKHAVARSMARTATPNGL